MLRYSDVVAAPATTIIPLVYPVSYRLEVVLMGHSLTVVMHIPPLQMSLLTCRLLHSDPRVCLPAPDNVISGALRASSGLMRAAGSEQMVLA